MDLQNHMSCFVSPVIVRAVAVIRIFHDNSSGSARRCSLRWQTDQLYVSKGSLRCERHISSLWIWTMPRWPLIVGHPLPSMLRFISSIEYSWNEAMFREMERAAKSPAAPIYSPVNFPALSWSLMSSTSVILNILLSLSPTPHLFLFLSFFHAAVREDAWFMKLYFYQLLRGKKGGEKQWQKGEREKRKEEWRAWRASPRGRRTGAWGGDIHHPATIGWKWRWEVGWDRNMMDLTKIRPDVLWNTRVVHCCWTQLGD